MSSAEPKTAWLEGRVARVLYASEETGYAVVRVTTPSEINITAVGTLAAVSDEIKPGDFLTLEGKWESHPVHGRQFRCTGYLSGSPRSLDGIRLYLAGGNIANIGTAMAERIVDHFGRQTPEIIANSPQRLTEVSGIGKKRAAAIAKAWQADEEGRALTMTLRGLGLAPRLIRRVRKAFGEQTLHVVTRTPYRLAEEISGIGFRTADGMARKQGIPLDDPMRARAAVVHVLGADTNEGHCFRTRRELVQRVTSLQVPTERVDDAIGEAEAIGKVVVEEGEQPGDDRIWGAGLYRAEVNVASHLLLRASTALPKPTTPKEVELAQRYVGVELDDGQTAAVEMALQSGISVITGGPGTGKTTLVKVLMRAARERGEEWLLASPTGRAARRLADATGGEAKTLHRLLEYRPDEGGFQRTLINPIEGDGLVIDEVSMVDIELMSAVLDAMPDRNFPIVLVGDSDQLPSVGPGQVLRDIIASGSVPVAELKTIHRQGTESGIVAAAASINAGEVPVSGEKAGYDDLFLLQRPDPVRLLLKVVAQRLPAKGFDARRDVQVLAPTRRGPLGTQELNKLLQAELNPDGKAVKRRDKEYRVGDRIICTRNRYDVEVFNGDTGEVLDVLKTGLLCEFEGRKVEWGWEDLNLLDLAYAITVHKSQGSEYPAVVLALGRSHGVMLRRNLFYTGITRAKKFCCVVGDGKAWYRAVKTVGGDHRNTALSERLSAASGQP